MPITNAVVLTGHKTQGMTLDNIVLDSMGDKHRYGSTGWLYVVLSSVRDISGLFKSSLSLQIEASTKNGMTYYKKWIAYEQWKTLLYKEYYLS